MFVIEASKDIKSSALVKRLTNDPTSEWHEYGSRAHRVTEREVAALLRRLHVRPHPIGKQRIRGYHRQDFLEKEIFQHFLGLDPLIRSPQQKKGSSPKKKRRRKKAKKASG